MSDRATVINQGPSGCLLFFLGAIFGAGTILFLLAMVL